MSTVTHDPIRVLLYSHDSQGLGHIRRNLALAHALTDQLPALTGRPVTGMLLTGAGTAITEPLPAGFDLVVLPGVRKSRSGYRPRNVTVPMADLLDVRERMLGAALRGFHPDLVVLDRHAYGIDGELRGELHRLRHSRPAVRLVLGLREILDDPQSAAKEWAGLGRPEQLRDLFDAIWAYGDPRVHDLRATGELPPALHDLVTFTGYLADGRRYTGPDPGAPVDPPYVMTTVGGGSDGRAVCRAAAQARVPAGYRHLVVTGPQMPATHQREIAALVDGEQTQVVESLPDPVGALRTAAAVVSMAGYNTTCELMTTSTPVLLVPREVPRLEQFIRAEGLTRVGAFEHCPADQLTPERLSDWLADAVTRTRSRAGLDLAGLQQVPREAATLLGYPARPHTGAYPGVPHTEELSGVAG